MGVDWHAEFSACRLVVMFGKEHMEPTPYLLVNHTWH